MEGVKDISTDLVKVLKNVDGVAILELNRPEKRNAFSQAMIDAIVTALDHLDRRTDVRALVVTSTRGSPFSAGMDLEELVQISTAEAHQRQFLKDLTDAFALFTKPSVAAVVGFALGGGFEIALACDMIYAAEDAIFGLPEIKIGTIPGAGGTQRLTRALGKQKAMEFILTGNTASGVEFERLGLISRVWPEEGQVLDEALGLAGRIAAMSAPVVATAKQAVLTGENSCPQVDEDSDTDWQVDRYRTAEASHLDGGLVHEKALYYSTFSTNDCKEGMTAFLEKRPPKFEHR